MRNMYDRWLPLKVRGRFKTESQLVEHLLNVAEEADLHSPTV